MVIRRGLPVDFSDDEEWITVTGDGVKREPPEPPMGPLRVVDVPPTDKVLPVKLPLPPKDPDGG